MMFKILQQGNQFICAKNPIWNQGQGGNVSYKENNTLFIKASGTRLDQITSRQDLVALDLSKLNNNLLELAHAEVTIPQEEIEKQYPLTLKSSALPSQTKSPSMETGFHAILPKPYVFHFHSLMALIIAEALINQKDPLAKHWLESAFKKFNLKVASIQFTLPGWSLIKETKAYTDCDVLILKNHGVIIQSTSDQTLSDWWNLELQFAQEFKISSIADLMSNPIKLTDLISRYSKGEFKYFFPDSAVFAKKIQERITPVKSNTEKPVFEYHSTGTSDDINYLELWIATQIINSIQTDKFGFIPEIPIELCAQIQGLPAEQLRKIEGKPKKDTP